MADGHPRGTFVGVHLAFDNLLSSTLGDG